MSEGWGKSIDRLSRLEMAEMKKDLREGNTPILREWQRRLALKLLEREIEVYDFENVWHG